MAATLSLAALSAGYSGRKPWARYLIAFDLGLPQLRLEREDRRIGADRREAEQGLPIAGFLQAHEALVLRLLVDAVAGRLRGLGAHVRVLLDDGGGAVVEGHGVVLLLVLLQRALAGLDLLPLLLELTGEEVGGLLRRLQASEEPTLDVLVRDRVGCLGGELRVPRAVAHVDDMRLPDGLDCEPSAEAVDEARLLARLVGLGRRDPLRRADEPGRPGRHAAERRRVRDRDGGRRRLLVKPERLHRAPRQTPAPQDLVLRLVEVVVVPTLLVVDDRVDGGGSARLLLDEDFRGRLVDLRLLQRADRAGRKDHEKRQTGGPTPLVDHAQVVGEMQSLGRKSGGRRRSGHDSLV